MKWQLWQFDGEGSPPERVLAPGFRANMELDEAIALAQEAYPELDGIQADLSRVGARYAELPYGCFVLVPVE